MGLPANQLPPEYPMITEDEVVEVESWQQMQEDPLFQWDVDTGAVGLGRPIGIYALSTEEECRILQCRRRHAKGVFVELDNGRRTYVGNCCGVKRFPKLKDQLKVLNKTTSRMRSRKSRADRIKELRGLLTDYRKFLGTQGQQVKRIINEFKDREEVSLQLARRLEEYSTFGTYAVVADRKRSKKEQEEYRERYPDASADDIKYEVKRYGDVVGLRAFRVWDLDTAAASIREAIQHLEKLDPDCHAPHRIDAAVNTSRETVEADIERAKRVTADFPRFVRPANLALLYLVVSTSAPKDTPLARLGFNSTAGEWVELSEAEAEARRRSIKRK